MESLRNFFKKKSPRARARALASSKHSSRDFSSSDFFSRLHSLVTLLGYIDATQLDRTRLNASPTRRVLFMHFPTKCTYLLKCRNARCRTPRRVPAITRSRCETVRYLSWEAKTDAHTYTCTHTHTHLYTQVRDRTKIPAETRASKIDSSITIITLHESETRSESPIEVLSIAPCEFRNAMFEYTRVNRAIDRIADVDRKRASHRDIAAVFARSRFDRQGPDSDRRVSQIDRFINARKRTEK